MSAGNEGGGKGPDSSNLYEVHREGNEVRFRLTPAGMFPGPPWAQMRVSMERRHALILAVWAALMADPELKEFHRLVEEIKK